MRTVMEKNPSRKPSKPHQLPTPSHLYLQFQAQHSLSLSLSLQTPSPVFLPFRHKTSQFKTSEFNLSFYKKGLWKVLGIFCLTLFVLCSLPRIKKKTMGGADGKIYTLAQVAEHNNSKDCWLIIGGKVYDVTKFLDDHPGGDDVLLSATGKDATDDFEDVGHSTGAREMLDKYFVGEIDVSTIPTKTKYTPPKQPYYNQDKTSEFITKLLQFLVPLAILGLAVAIRFYTKSS